MADLLVEGLDSLIKDPKALEDFSAEATALSVEVRALATAGRLAEAQERLLALEKRARQQYDSATVSSLCLLLITLHFEKRDITSLCDAIVLLVKRRGQLKRPIADLVNLASSWIPLLDREPRLELLHCLTAVTEGKLFVEAERARLRRTEAHMLEEEGKLDEAVAILQDEQVEVIVAMGKREKTEYILDQMRIVLRKGDFIRLQIISRKINTKQLDRDLEISDLKIKYYEMMVHFWLHESDYNEVTRCYQAIYNTPGLGQTNESLEAAVFYVLLAPRTAEQEKLLASLLQSELRRLEQLAPFFVALLEQFQSKELISWPLPAAASISTHRVFTDAAHADGASRYEVLRKRVVQHNLTRVIASFFTRATLSRLGELLGITASEVESEIAGLASAGKVHAKIDRPAGVVVFGQSKTPQEQLDASAGILHELFDLVEKTSHLIQKERMVHAAKEKISRAQKA